MTMTVAQANLLTSKYLDYNYYLDDDGEVHVSRFSVDNGFEYFIIDRKGKVS